MKTYIFLLIVIISSITLAITSTKTIDVEVTKSLKILNIHDTTDAKILLA